MENYIEKLSTYTSYLSTRRNIISNNISNSNTPNYKAQDVIFHEELESSISLHKPNTRHKGTNSKLYQTNEKHIVVGTQNSQIEYTTNENKVNDDGNSVDVTTQMVELMKVSQLQSVIVNAINTQSEINSAARGK